MSIDKLRQSNALKSLTGNKLLSTDIANILSDNRWQTETRHRTTLSGAAMIFASVCLLAPNYSFAKGNKTNKKPQTKV